MEQLLQMLIDFIVSNGMPTDVLSLIVIGIVAIVAMLIILFKYKILAGDKKSSDDLIQDLKIEELKIKIMDNRSKIEKIEEEKNKK